jgi:glutathione S-transferase
MQTAEILQYFDAHLKHRMYVAGMEFSMGDIPMGCAIWRWMSLPIERPVLANVQRWSVRLDGQPPATRSGG